MDSEVIDLLKKDIDYLIKNDNLSKKNNDLWTSRASVSSKKISLENTQHVFENFRANQFLINEYPPFTKNFFNNLIPYKNLVFKNVIKKFNLLNDEEVLLLKNELLFNKVGNPPYLRKNGISFNKRWIYNIHYTYLIKTFIKDVFKDENKIVCDIGGGYGILSYMLKKLNFSGNYILIEFPEQLLTAKYFLKSNFTNLKINSLEETFEHKHNFDNNFVKKFDVFLCPINLFYKINSLKINLVTNFFSFGEMSKENFSKYMKSDLLKNTEYFLSINRLFSKIEYGTDIDILDYNYHNFQKLYFAEHKFDVDYILQYKRYFGLTKNINSLFVEFIGKKNEKK